ncbi:MAG TPA: histidine kinase [Burkholderiales bacterium]|nr:histidine kinase [Burkholderiales bacterium]
MADVDRNAHSDALPDFRNLGVAVRILLLSNIAGFAAALIQSGGAAQFAYQFMALAAALEPVLLLSLVSLYALSKWLARLPYGWGVAAVVLLAMSWTAAVLNAGVLLGNAITPFGLVRAWILCALLTAFLLAYFFWRKRAFSPALTDARLQALQARIRPHFLFNSLNAVLSLIRSDPKRAEETLEDLAELFRTLMQDNRRLTTLAEELALCRQYLNLEQLRLGERLRVEWDIATMPGDALVPQLLLQPLVENAIFHGIEPGIEPGTVRICLARDKNQVRLLLTNPYHPDYQHRAGNRMALANIRERLALHFDVEANLHTEVVGDSFEIRIVLPYRGKE